MNTVSDLALVLHSIAWRETSLIVEVFTRHHGRLGLIAKGARRPRSALRGLLQPFQPLEVRWVDRSFGPSCWCWSIVEVSPDGARAHLTSGSLPDAKTVLQAQGMAEAAALAYAKALVTALEGGAK